LHVLGDFLRNGYLHRAIREQGGAYGGGAGYHPDSGAFRFHSYRDPRLADTLADFDRALDWLHTHDHPARTLEEAILGVIAAIDKPGSPAGEAISAFFGTCLAVPRTAPRLSATVLAVTLDDLRRVATDLSATGTGPLRGAEQRADAGGTGEISLSSRFDRSGLLARRIFLGEKPPLTRQRGWR
jgi:Zn-dependent M16 (insulinase) family peptidase